ncbi:MAG: MBL fold metallo-hydrolase [Leptospiraceae bacterium]|nr:MBL fold metallo-hydrolase [Leptospiraceae bacterium]
MHNIKIKFYGTRGSIPISGSQFNEYGGNTTCVLVEADDQICIIDAGTGIRNLGNDLLQREFAGQGGFARIFFTHTHWDHIQGFPFFIPLYIPGNHFEIYGQTKTVQEKVWDIETSLIGQTNYMYFPINLKDMASKKTFKDISPGQTLQFGELKISTIALTHPNVTLGFRFDCGKNSFVFCTDVEHNDQLIRDLAEFSRNADVLAYDCQYTPEEYENGKQGWGHSTFEKAIEICKLGSVKKLSMIHHDPAHDDKAIRNIESRARTLFPAATAVKEGDTITLTS